MRLATAWECNWLGLVPIAKRSAMAQSSIRSEVDPVLVTIRNYRLYGFVDKA